MNHEKHEKKSVEAALAPGPAQPVHVRRTMGLKYGNQSRVDRFFVCFVYFVVKNLLYYSINFMLISRFVAPPHDLILVIESQLFNSFFSRYLNGNSVNGTG